MKICIIIPAYNESRTIGPLVEAIKSKRLDVLVVDDGSKDKTGDIALSKGAQVIQNSRKMGKGFSLKKGFNELKKNSYDGIITMDGDGQHDPEDLDQFIQVAQEHPSSVITGNRLDNAKGMPLIRYLTNRTMSFFISKALRQKVPDTQCGYRYISMDILKELDLRSNDFEIETEVLFKASKKNKMIYSVPVKTIYSVEESKINPFLDTIRFCVYFIKELFSKN